MKKNIRPLESDLLGIAGALFFDIPIGRKQNSGCVWREAYNKYRCDYVYGASLTGRPFFEAILVALSFNESNIRLFAALFVVCSLILRFSAR